MSDKVTDGGVEEPIPEWTAAFDKLRLAENQPTKIVKHETQENLNRMVAVFNAISDAYDRSDKAEEERLIGRMGGTPVPGLTKDKDA